MRSICLSLALLTIAPARADEKLERPATAARRAAQVLGIGALVLVVAGAASFGVALSRYDALGGGCGATASCSSSDVGNGKLAQDLGWSFVGAGVACGVAAMVLAWLDARPRPQVALVPTGSGIALAGRFW